MPKGRHKGARRQFTDFKAEDLKKEKEEKELAWRQQRGELPSDEEGEEGKEKVVKSDSESEEESEEESESSEEEGEKKVPKAKGVSGLIELENPNRVGNKANRKVTDLENPGGAAGGAPSKPQLSRREREEVEKQRSAASYRKLHAAGKTDEARADLERLAIIKQKRGEAEQKRKEQLDAKAQAAKASSKS